MEDYHFSKYLIIDVQQGHVFVQKPEANMQTDAACFEAAVLYLKAKHPDAEITVGFRAVNWPGTFENLTRDQSHYMRFLYRLLRFTERMNWCHADEAGQKELARFDTALQSAKLICNKPEQDAKCNPKKGAEHLLENLLVGKMRPYFEQLLSNTDLHMTYLDHQLPNGLFDGEACNQKRIFPTGYIDIWGINDKNELCIFELKTDDNTKMGLLSELFFYAQFSKEFLLNNQCLLVAKKLYRGYGELLEAVTAGCKSVRAFFLTGEKIHPVIRHYQHQIIDLLNGGERSIHFEFLQYDKNQFV
jgi:hypothetical protein